MWAMSWSRITSYTFSASWLAAVVLPVNSALFLYQYEQQKGDIYNILWALVFGFATLNILGLAGRRFDPAQRGLSLGETVAIMVVVVSVFLLGWEMLYVFHILPIQLHPHY